MTHHLMFKIRCIFTIGKSSKMVGVFRIPCVGETILVDGERYLVKTVLHDADRGAEIYVY